MRAILLYPSIHAIIGSGDKLYDEGLCGAFGEGAGGSDISKEQTGAAHRTWRAI
jgi:hypothetical protein